MRRRLVCDLSMHLLRDGTPPLPTLSGLVLNAWEAAGRPVYVVTDAARKAIADRPAESWRQALVEGIEAGARLGPVYVAPERPLPFLGVSPHRRGAMEDGCWLVCVPALTTADPLLMDFSGQPGSRPALVCQVATQEANDAAGLLPAMVAQPTGGDEIAVCIDGSRAGVPREAMEWMIASAALLRALAHRIVVHPVLVTDRRGQREHARGRTSVHRYHVLRVVERGTATLERGAPVHVERGRVGLGIRLGAPPAPPARHVVHEHAHRHWLRPATAEREGYVLDPDAPVHPRLVRAWVPHRQHERGRGELRARETVVRG